MRKIDVNLWINYHTHPKSHYSEEELREIRASEFAMHLLVPTKAFLKRVDLDKVREYTFLEKYQLVTDEATYFGVPPEVISVKLEELLEQDKKEEAIDEPKSLGKIKSLFKRKK